MLISAKNRIFVGVLICLMMVTSLGLMAFSANNAHAEEIVKKPITIEKLRYADPAQLAQLDKFDSREYNLIPNKNRNQISTNLCWAFATLGAVEANILRQGFVAVIAGVGATGVGIGTAVWVILFRRRRRL